MKCTQATVLDFQAYLAHMETSDSLDYIEDQSPQVDWHVATTGCGSSLPNTPTTMK